MGMRSCLCLLIAGVLILLGSGCAIMHRSTHGMSVSVSMGDRYDKAVHEVLARDDCASQTLPAALEQVRQADAADYAEIIRLTDEWAKREGFCRIPTEWFNGKQHVHLIPQLDRPNGQYIYYEEHGPASPNWPIQLLIYVVEDYPGSRMYDVNITAAEGFSRQPSERLRRVHDTLRETMVRRFGEQRVHGSIY